MAVKHCKVCGKEFIDYGRGKYCEGPHYKTCIVCRKEFEYDVRAVNIPKTCSRSCASKLAHKTMHYKPKFCKYCNAEFIPASGRQLFCSDECKNLASNS